MLSSTVGPSEGTHGEVVARAGAEEEEAGKAKRGSQWDGEWPYQETARENQLCFPDSFCKLNLISHTIKFKENNSEILYQCYNGLQSDLQLCTDCTEH